MWLGYTIRLPVQIGQNRFSLSVVLKAAHDKRSSRNYREGKAREAGHEITEVESVKIARALHKGQRLIKVNHWCVPICGCISIIIRRSCDRSRVDSMTIILLGEKVISEIVQPIFCNLK